MDVEGEEKKVYKTFCFILQKWSILESKVKLEAKASIVHLCNLNGFWDMIKNKICQFSKIFIFFTISHSNFRIFLQKRKIWKNIFYTNLVVSLKVIELQRCTIPHFEALDLLFWPLAWLLTLGSIILALWHKTFVYFFLLTLYIRPKVTLFLLVSSFSACITLHFKIK